MDFIKKLNDWIFQVERWIVVVSLTVMSVVVFLSVVYRRYADPESVLATKIADWFFDAERGTSTWQTLQDIANPISLVAIAAVVYLGFRTASRRPLWNRGDETGKTEAEIHGEPLSHGMCALYTVLTVLAAWGLMVLLFGTGKIAQNECIEMASKGDRSLACGRFPAGLNWAQPFALILTLWVSFIGASMATKENLHLKVEAVQQALPEKLQRISGLISGLFTAAFCLLLAYLSMKWAEGKHEEWQNSDHLGGLHVGVEIPYWMSFSIVPIAYLLMSVRFIGLGYLAFKGELEGGPAELRDLDLPPADDAAATPAPAVAEPEPPDRPSRPAEPDSPTVDDSGTLPALDPDADTADDGPANGQEDEG